MYTVKYVYSGKHWIKQFYYYYNNKMEGWN